MDTPPETKPYASMTPEEREEEIDRILLILSGLYARQQTLTKQERGVRTERREVRSKITHTESRLSILRGERVGGRPPATFVGDSYRSIVQTLIETQPEKLWTPDSVAEAMNEPKGRINRVLVNLVEFNRIERVSRGVYRANPGALGPKHDTVHKKRRGSLRDLVQESLDADPTEVWTVKKLLAQGLADTTNQARSVIDDLHGQGRIKRVYRGHYASLKHDGVKQKKTNRDKAKARGEFWRENA